MPRNGADPYVPGHGDRRWSATAYTLDLDYRVATNHLSGSARIGVALSAQTKEIHLDLYGLRVSRVLLDGRKVKQFIQNGSRLRVTLPSGCPQRCELTVEYAGKPRPMPGPGGSAGWEELTDGVLVGSQPHGAPSWFPCNDRPDDKAPYEVSVTVEAGYHVVGNGVLTSHATRSGRSRWTYLQAEPMAPYLACVQIGRYAATLVSVGEVPVEIVAPPGTALGPGTAFAAQGEMVATLSTWFGRYPYATYRAVIANDTFEIPLEAQGLASFGINHLSPTWENERLVVHELAHSWFGNSLTAQTWRDIWLHEGFACYTEWLWSEHRGILSTQERAQEHWSRLAELPQDLLLGDPGAATMFDDRVYKRGALTLHALRMLLGTDVFFSVLREWTASWAHGVVTTADFVEHVAGRSELIDPRASTHVRALIGEWVYQPRLPALPGA